MSLLRRLFSIFLIFISANSYAATKESALTQLQKIIKPINSVRANFSQNVYSNTQTVVQSASGNMEFRRPTAFRWQILEPDASLIVTNGEKVWNYDSSLEQVVVQNFKINAEVTPISFLFDDATKLAENFEVKKAAVGCFDLTPKAENPNFASMQVCFNKNKIQTLKVFDHLDQTSVFTFTQVQNNPEIKDENFVFVAPKGVDVINES